MVTHVEFRTSLDVVLPDALTIRPPGRDKIVCG